MKQNIIELSSKDLQYIISESVKKVLKEKTDLNSLKRYLTMPDDRKFLWNVKRHSSEFINYLKAKGVLGELDTYDTFDKLIANYGQYVKPYNNEILNAQTDYLYGGDVDAEFQNSNMYMDYVEDSNEWLFHFTNKAYDIMKDGFLGLTDKDSIHRTYGYGYRRALGKGYGFAYTLDNLPSKNIFRSEYLIIFKAPSVKIKHRVDGDIQNVFDVKDVDRKNVYIFKLNNKKDEAYYGGDGEVYTDDPTVESMVCCYPNNFKGLQVNTPAEALQAIEKGNYQSTEKEINYDEVNRLVSYFETLQNAIIHKSMNKIFIGYYIGEGNYQDTNNFKPWKPENYFIHPLVNMLVKNGYEIRLQDDDEFILRNKQGDVKIKLQQYYDCGKSSMAVTIKF
jgi:hypothetical protein